jgi:hypothetical protein
MIKIQKRDVTVENSKMQLLKKDVKTSNPSTGTTQQYFTKRWNLAQKSLTKLHHAGKTMVNNGL